MSQVKRVESYFLNQYGDAIEYEKRYKKRKSEGNVSEVMESRRKKYRRRMNQVKKAIAGLDRERDREIVTARCIDGASWEEIGRIQGVTPATASRYYFRIIQKIKVPEEVKKEYAEKLER